MTNPDRSRTPAEMGFAMPAEWEPHEATWIAWPHNRTDWPGKLATVQWAYGEIVRKIAPGEKVRILVQSAGHEQAARRILRKARADIAQVEFFRWATDRSWTRDFGPIFLRQGTGRGGELAIADFRFNAWGNRYPDWGRDDRVAARAARGLGLRRFEPRIGRRRFVLEGGAIDVNGRGTVLTTEECLLDPAVQVRNPGLDRAAVERALRDFLGVRNVLWLGAGVAGDDTHGHVDDICRFVRRDTVVLVQERHGDDANFAPLQDNRRRLEGMRLADGSRINVVDLPCPGPLYFGDMRLPASYANFYVANAAVLVPTFNDPADRAALGTLADLFPGRTATGISAVDLVLGQGTLHCLTQQQPAA